MKRAKYFVLGAIEAVLIAVFVFLSVWWFGRSYKDFYGAAAASYPIPGLESGISPQGLCTLPASDAVPDEFEGCFAMSGYLSGQPSRVYLVGPDGTNFHTTFTEKGKDISTHFGGVTCTDTHLYIASGGKILSVAFEKFFGAENGGAVEIDGSFQTGLGNAFCYFEGGLLYAGEFYRPGNYETDPAHHLTWDGEENPAFVYAFRADKSAPCGFEETPAFVLSVREQVQGFAVSGGKIYLSTSYGLPDSELFVYRDPTSEKERGTVSINGTEVPLYALCADNLLSTVTLPCMSEEVCIKDGSLCILFESMSKKYRYVVHHRISRIYTLPLSSL